MYTDPIGFSKLDTYRKCPQQFKFQYIDKLPQPSSPAMERGQKMHQELENYLRGWATTPPTAALEWQEQLDNLKQLQAKTEVAWGFDMDWNLLPDWFHKDTWLRAKADAFYLTASGDELVIIDFKSGKYRVPSTEQIELYAICGASVVCPTVKTVRAEFWFIDANNSYDKTYTRPHLVELRKKYEDYFAPIFKDETWKPQPSNDCRYCAYSNSKGGKCAF